MSKLDEGLKQILESLTAAVAGYNTAQDGRKDMDEQLAELRTEVGGLRERIDHMNETIVELQRIILER